MPYKKLEIEGFIGFRLQQTAWNARAQFQKIIKHLGLEITLEQAQVILSLYKSEGVSQVQLADNVFKGRTNITRIIGGLENKGYIERRKDALDKRCMRIYLTEDGIEIVNQVIPILIKSNQQLIQQIGADSHQNIMNTLDQLNVIISNLYSSFLKTARKD